MAQWDQEVNKKLATSPKSWALQYNVGCPPTRYHHIPMPKAAGGSREGRVLRQTFEKIEGFRQVTTPEFRANCFRGKATSIGFLPHPSVLSDDMGPKLGCRSLAKLRRGILLTCLSRLCVSLMVCRCSFLYRILTCRCWMSTVPSSIRV